MSKKCKICGIYEPTASYMVISKWASNRYKWSLKQKLNIRKG